MIGSDPTAEDPAVPNEVSPTDSPARGDAGQQLRTINLKLPGVLIERIDALKSEYGLRSRGALVERLLTNLLSLEPDSHTQEDLDQGVLDEQGALVLVAREGSEELCLDLAISPESGRASTGSPETADRSGPSARGIDLPGFVQRRSDQVRRSLSRPARATPAPADPLPSVQADLLESARERVRAHWLELYGKSANDTVLEAAMVWLAQDIWPQSDQSDGRPFSWSLACETMANLTPSWSTAEPSFELVIVVAGVLEDPFSCSTLLVRVPTLIRRFVHRFRRRRGTSFQTLEHTMTLHGALRLLQLPTAPGHRLTLAEIREAYRSMALANHPDAGGSEEAMRRLNEAYQLLKELYRQPSA